MKRWVVVAGSLTLLWMILVNRFDLGGLLPGIVLGFVAVYPFRRIYSDERVGVFRIAKAIPAFLIYLVIFAKDVIVANLDVAWRILAPSLPIEPRVVIVPLRVESDYAITTIANSITLTPGTLSMNYDEDKHALYVHSMSGKNIVGPIRVWERYAIRIFEPENDTREEELEEVITGKEMNQMLEGSEGVRTESGAEKKKEDESDEIDDASKNGGNGSGSGGGDQ